MKTIYIELTTEKGEIVQGAEWEKLKRQFKTLVTPFGFKVKRLEVQE